MEPWAMSIPPCLGGSSYSVRWSRSVFAKARTCKFKIVGGCSLGTRLAARTLREHIAFWPFCDLRDGRTGSVPDASTRFTSTRVSLAELVNRR
jgi:hypothetical protein